MSENLIVIPNKTIMYLTASSIRYGIKLCHLLTRYRCLILIDRKADISYVANYIEEIVSDKTNDIDKIIKTAHSGQIFFKNGSYLRWDRAVEDKRGLKTHLLITNSIDNNYLHTIALPMLIDYYDIV